MKANLLRRVLAAKVTAFVVLALIVAVVLGAASTAQAHDGDTRLFHLNHSNAVSAINQLVGSVVGPILRIDNNSTGAGATALDLQVEPGKAPMTVNSSAKVANLNADQLDGKDSTQFLSAEPYTVPNTDSVLGGATNQSILVKCDQGDIALSGGADGIEYPTQLNEVSKLFGTSDTWEVEVSRQFVTSEDPNGVIAEVYCWDLPPIRSTN
jgi:hypothetical protein